MYQTTQSSKGNFDTNLYPTHRKEQLRAMTETGRLMAVHRLATRLAKLAETAREQRQLDLERTLSEIARAFRNSSCEIAAACYGPSLICELAASVARIQSNLSPAEMNEG